MVRAHSVRFTCAYLTANAYQPVQSENDPFSNWPPPTSSGNSVSSSYSSRSNGVNTQSLSNLKMKASPAPPLNENDWMIPSAQQKISQQDTNDFGDFFSSPGPQEAPPKLAPPPAAGLGKGRGRNPIRPILSPQVSRNTRNSSTEQSSLLDLL